MDVARNFRMLLGGDSRWISLGVRMYNELRKFKKMTMKGIDDDDDDSDEGPQPAPRII